MVEDPVATAVEEDSPVVAAGSALVVASQAVDMVVDSPVVEVDFPVAGQADTPVVDMVVDSQAVEDSPVAVDTVVDSQAVVDVEVEDAVEAVFLADLPVDTPAVVEDFQAVVDSAVEVAMVDSLAVEEDVEVVDVEVVASPVVTAAVVVAVLAGENKHLSGNRVANFTTKFPKLRAIKV